MTRDVRYRQVQQGLGDFTAGDTLVGAVGLGVGLLEKAHPQLGVGGAREGQPRLEYLPTVVRVCVRVCVRVGGCGLVCQGSRTWSARLGFSVQGRRSSTTMVRHTWSRLGVPKPLQTPPFSHITNLQTMVYRHTFTPIPSTRAVARLPKDLHCPSMKSRRA